MSGEAALLALRRGTSQHHRRLEEALDLLADDLTLARWRRALGGLLTVVEPLESALDAAPPPVPDWPERRRASLLRADAGDPELPPAPDLPVPSTPARAMGCLYVLEGSTLGAPQVVAHVRHVLGIGAGLRWFTAYGDAAPARWRTFRRSLGGHDPDDLVDAARGTFDALLAAAS